MDFLLPQIPEEEKSLGPHDRMIHVYHFLKDTAQNQMVRLNGFAVYTFFYLVLKILLKLNSFSTNLHLSLPLKLSNVMLWWYFGNISMFRTLETLSSWLSVRVRL